MTIHGKYLNITDEVILSDFPQNVMVGTVYVVFPPSVSAFKWIKMNIVPKCIACKEFRFIRPLTQHMSLHVEQLKLIIKIRKQDKTNHTRGNMDINIHNPLKNNYPTQWLRKSQIGAIQISRAYAFHRVDREAVLCRSHQMTLFDWGNLSYAHFVG